MFKYGMRLRPFSIGCQPMNGLIKVEDDTTGKYWDILYYANPLNDHEQDEFELDYLGEEVEYKIRIQMEETKNDCTYQFQGNNRSVRSVT